MSETAKVSGISTGRIEYISQHCFTWAYQHLLAISNVDKSVALESVADAANAFGNRLSLALREHGVEVEVREL